jgi:hypothetical protein
MLLKPQGLLGKVEWGFLKAPFVKAREIMSKPVETTSGQ